MPSFEERLSNLEGRVQEQTNRLGELPQMFQHLDAKIDEKFHQLDAKIDRTFQQLDTKIDTKIDGLDTKIDRKIDTLRADMTNQFRWTIGIMLTLAAGVATAVIAAILHR